MYSLSSANSTVSIPTTHIVNVPQIDRWRVCYRLQELMIPCWCLADGTLRVEVQDAIAVILLRSVIQQFLASRKDLVTWLDRCWQTEF
jgi:hypothetical protein